MFGCLTPAIKHTLILVKSELVPSDYKTHCLICKHSLDFELAQKNPGVAKYQISTIWVDKKTSKSKFHGTLENVCKGRTDALSVEVAAKISYAGCLHALEAKYHRDCMQRFLSAVSIAEAKTNQCNYSEPKNVAFEKFCEWYENNKHQSTSTLYDVKMHMEQLSGSESIYSISQISRKLSERDEICVTNVCGRPSIVMFKEEANQIVFDSSIDALNDSALEDIISVGKLIQENLQNADEFNEFYQGVGELQLKHLHAIVPNQLVCLLDSIFSKSRSETAQAKKELRKVGIAHAIMQWCRKEGYISPLLLAVELFVHQVTRLVFL